MTEKTVRRRSLSRRTMLAGTAGVLGGAVLAATPAQAQTSAPATAVTPGSAPPGSRYGDPAWWAKGKEEILEPALAARDGRPKGWISITVERTDGRSVTVEASDPIGSPQKPLTNPQFEAKFRDRAGNAVQPLSDASVDAVLAAIGRLEMLPDARQLMTPFAE